MRRGYQLARWRRRAETISRKAEELFDEIRTAEGDNSAITGGAHGAVIGAGELVAALLPNNAEA